MKNLTNEQKEYLVEKYFVDTVRGTNLHGAANIGMELLENGTCVIAGEQNHWRHLGVTEEVTKDFIGCIRLNLKLEDLFNCATFKQYHKDYLTYYNQEVDKAKKRLTDAINKHQCLMVLSIDND